MIKRLFNLYDDIFKKLKLEIYTDESGTIYGKWFDKNEKLIFSRNHFGTLWVDDCDSYTTLWIYSKALSLNKEEFELSLIDYLNLKYQNQSKNRPIKSIGDENHCLEDMEDETENLQETIRRILREDYSPAGKEIIPNKIVVHKSNPMFRDRILEEGLKVRVGECYQIYVNREQRDPNKIKCKPVIFATNSTKKRDLFDSTYDDDIWEINTEMIPDVKWYVDRHYGSKSKHIVTYQDIPTEAITLIYEGTGESEDLIEESIRRILREETDFYYNLKTVAFEELPFEYQRSLIIYMYEGPVVDWSLDLDRDIVSKNDELVKVLINDYMSVGRNKNKSFAYGIVPMKTLTKEIAERMGYDNYNDYHKDYVGSNYVQKHKESVWPIILNPDNDELIEDGWHRFHDYYSRGLKKVPVVMFM
jgi:hypothetical protein